MMNTATQSKFETMYNAIDLHDSSKVADVVNVLAGKSKRTKEEDFVFFVAKVVLNDRVEVKA